MARILRWSCFLVLGACCGCGTAAKQALHTVMGATGKFYEVKVVDPAALAGYRRIRVDRFTNDLGSMLPANVITEVNDKVPAAIVDTDLFGDSGKVIAVRGTIVHYTGRSALTGGVGSIIGGGEVCVCRVRLVDGESDKLVGEAVCWGTVKSAVRLGTGELAKGVGKAVAKWLSERMPDDEKEARRESIREKREQQE